MSGRHEFPDPTPVEMPLGFRRPPTLQEEIQRIVRIQMSQQAQEHGFESFEEADDFEVDDDPDPLSAYEVLEMAPEGPTASETESGRPVATPPPAPAAPPAPAGVVAPDAA